MSDVVVVPPLGGEVIGDSRERRVEILSDDDALHATWSRFAPRREGADLHVHRLHNDLFYVLEGDLTVRLGVADAEVTVSAGTVAHVPPLVVHGFRNASDADVVYLNFHAPGRQFADYLRAARDGRSFSYDQYPPPPDDERPATDATVGGEEVVAGAAMTVKLLVDVDEIAIAERCGDAPGAAGGSPVHRRHVESIYVLKGTLTLAAHEREVRAEPGTWLQVPPGVPHSLSAAAGGARFLEVHSPSCGFGAFLRAHGGGEGAAETGFDVAAA